MSTQQDIYAAGSENRPPMLNKENYVPWSSRLLRTEIKQMEADDQAHQTILLGHPEDHLCCHFDNCSTGYEYGSRQTDADGWELMGGKQLDIPESGDQNNWEWKSCSITAERQEIGILRNVQTQLLIAQKEEAGIQLQAEEFDLMAAAADLDEIEEVNANCILMANLQQASTSNTQIGPGLVPSKRFHKIKDEIFPIVNQVDARVQNFEIQFLKEAAKFVRDFQSFAKEADESLAKHKALELEIERRLRAVVSQDIMSIVQNNSVVDTSNLHTELKRTKERFENCIIKKKNKYAKLWNYWYKKCEECKFDKISYDKAYNDMQQKIERLQAQLGDQKGKCKDTPCVSNTFDSFSQKLENENVELEYQVRNYEKENAHLKTTYKNMFDYIKVTRTQTKAIIYSLQDKLHDMIYENAKLRAQLFDKVSEQKDTARGKSANTKFAKQSILGKPHSPFRPKLYVVTPLPKSMAFPKVGEKNTLSKQSLQTRFLSLMNQQL
ncbi:hypothetical protein Tco_0199037 [Tanacetum coccineum]